ncbi:putative enzyme of poly-gamma-glutamate biosynthesis (capsule formation) [Rivularia sp. PCC 7116]|uniref:CapA family protein n=1 Tax=Rivularia sp. PCC 7116 TaxID=373994 RepID=UPI00029F3AF7|nr:CapA family protein [Rivularia sp. PCC 7116]AFY58253.1 putative enzyme of poly-gamma-glutamate biosynthesis (capsule formation) [Rivularia sp. PCC 7116]
MNKFFKIALISTIIFFVGSPLTAIAQSQSQITLLAGGDVEWSRMAKESLFHREIIRYNLDFASKQEEARYPFQKIKPVLEDADISFVNLETPLSDTANKNGAFLAPTAFATGLKSAGIDVVSTANNHALDAGVAGLKDTLTSLSQVGLPAVGSGDNLASARLPYIFEKNGIRLGFLAYTMSENSGDSSYAKPNRAGVMPTDLSLIREDIQKLRSKVDYIILSFHWGLNDSEKPPFWVRNLARKSIDSGADIILGHHPHFPQGIEIYKNKPIIYCLGNFIFGHNHPYWTDNFLAKFILTPSQIKSIEILPIAGENQYLAQPFLLAGKTSQNLLKDVSNKSLALKTKMEIVGDIGVINPATAAMPKNEIDDLIYDLMLPKPLWQLLLALSAVGIVLTFIIRFGLSRFSRKRRRFARR